MLTSETDIQKMQKKEHSRFLPSSVLSKYLNNKVIKVDIDNGII